MRIVSSSPTKSQVSEFRLAFGVTWLAFVGMCQGACNLAGDTNPSSPTAGVGGSSRGGNGAYGGKPARGGASSVTSPPAEQSMQQLCAECTADCDACVSNASRIGVSARYCVDSCGCDCYCGAEACVYKQGCGCVGCARPEDDCACLAAAGISATFCSGLASAGGADGAGGVAPTTDGQGGTASSGGSGSGTEVADSSVDVQTCGRLQFEEFSSGLCLAKVAWFGTGDQSFSIDATEVTLAQYAVWLDATTAEDIAAQDPSTCGWNESFKPNGNWPPSSDSSRPVSNVDWCDASAYCRGVGKRLCGKVGGGSATYADFAKAGVDQWFTACTSNGTFNYPYGDTFSRGTCNGPDLDMRATVAVGSMASCVASGGGALGAYDLLGNVWEWQDSCDQISGGATANCRIRGGGFDAFAFGSSINNCSNGSHVMRSHASQSVGFRCCSP